MFNKLEITEKDIKTIKDSLNFVSDAIITPSKITDVPAISDVFNLIPDTNKSENLKIIFSIILAESCRYDGNILIERMFLEYAYENLSKMFGEYNNNLLSVILALSKCYKELGLLDESYIFLNKALKLVYFNTSETSLELLEVLNQFVMFSKQINETNEEGVYSELMGKIINKNFKKLKNSFKKILPENNFEADNQDKNFSNTSNNNSNKNPVKQNNDFLTFKHAPFETKIEFLIQISYFLKHLDYLSTYGKVGKNTDYIIKMFNYINEILENMEILVNKKIDFNSIFEEYEKHKNTSTDQNRVTTTFLENSNIFFYLSPEIKSLVLNSFVSKNAIKKDKKSNGQNVEQNINNIKENKLIESSGNLYFNKF